MDRITSSQSEHDAAVEAAAQIYRQEDKFVSVNPNGEKNESWNGRYIDVIVKESHLATSAWVIEIETDDSVSEAEAEEQWTDYDKSYKVWYLAVPVEAEDRTKELFRRFEIQNCQVVTWRRNNDDTHTFWDLPGIDA